MTLRHETKLGRTKHDEDMHGFDAMLAAGSDPLAATESEEDPLLPTVEGVSTLPSTTPAAQCFQRPAAITWEVFQARLQLLDKGLQDLVKLSDPGYSAEHLMQHGYKEWS